MDSNDIQLETVDNDFAVCGCVMDLNSSAPMERLIMDIAMPGFCGVEPRDQIQAINPSPTDKTSSFIRRLFGIRDLSKAVQDMIHR